MLMVITVYLSRTKLMFYMVRGGPNNTRIVKLMSGKEYQEYQNPETGSGCFYKRRPYKNSRRQGRTGSPAAR